MVAVKGVFPGGDDIEEIRDESNFDREIKVLPAPVSACIYLAIVVAIEVLTSEVCWLVESEENGAVLPITNL